MSIVYELQAIVNNGVMVKPGGGVRVGIPTWIFVKLLLNRVRIKQIS